MACCRLQRVEVMTAPTGGNRPVARQDAYSSNRLVAFEVAADLDQRRYSAAFRNNQKTMPFKRGFPIESSRWHFRILRLSLGFRQPDSRTWDGINLRAAGLDGRSWGDCSIVAGVQSAGSAAAGRPRT
jgi:hypothetical protein